MQLAVSECWGSQWESGNGRIGEDMQLDAPRVVP